ncbi:mechanosensitive ion channel [Opitutales bacterium]|mgnify:CR=1 FL=1|nr:mechanosensitive ion channel [Opitutales bacterium]
MPSSDKIPWNDIQKLWIDDELKYQLLALIALAILAAIFSSIAKRVFQKNTISNENEFKGWTSWKQYSLRLIPPSILLVLAILGLSGFRSLGFATIDLIQPAVNASVAWLLYRLIGIFTTNRAWLSSVAIILFGLAALQSFGILSATIELLEMVAFQLGDRRISVLDLINGIGILLILLWASSLLGSAGEKKIRQLPHIPPSLQVLLSKVFRTFLVVLSLAIALSTIGLDLSSFAILGGAIGVGIGFGLQKVVSNLVSGLILLVDRSIKPGDVIEIEGTYGWINSLRARYASVITRDGKEHLIPNEDLITNRVINWSFSDRNVRVRVPIGISYDANPRDAIQLCLDSANSSKRTLQDPEPKCLLTGFGENSIDLELRFWIDDPSNGVGNIRSEVLLGIWDRFQDGGIEIPFPHRDVRIINDDKSLSNLKD